RARPPSPGGLFVCAVALSSFIMRLAEHERKRAMARKKSAAERRAEQWAEHRRRREEEDRRQRVMVITEFDTGNSDATMHALADEILKYRQALRWLAAAIGWADAGAPFGLFPPGPLWRPRRTNESDVVPPAA